MRGRKRVPTFLKLVTGNPGRRPLPVDEPQPEGDLFAPPAWMTPDQQTCWRYAIDHAPKGLLRKLDAALLTIWVVAEDMHRKASEQVQKYGMVVKSPRGLPVRSPFLRIIDDQAEIMMRAASELGFSPTSRSRITLINKQPSNKNRFANNFATR